MGKGGKKVTENTLNKDGKRAMQDYLNYANAELISFSEWGVETWTNSHGEGRTGSKFTFHIGFRYMTDTGRYWTCILSRTTQGNLPVKGTLVNWGTEAPHPRDALEHYKNAKFPLPDSSSEPRGSDSGGDGGGGGGGAGGSSSGGGGWKKTIHSDGHGGYFYYDANWEVHMCDAQGNDTYYTTQTGVRTSNPRRIKAVFGPAGATYYYSSAGRQAGCVLKTESATNRQYFVDAQGRKWQACHFPPGHEPAEMKNARQPQPTAPSATRNAPAQRPTGTSNSSLGNSSNTSHSSQRKILIDPKTKRQYYIGSDCRAHWM